MPWLLDSSDLPRYGSESVKKDNAQTGARVDNGFDQWSVASFYTKRDFVLLFMVKQIIYLVIQVYLCKYIFTFYDLGIDFQTFLYFQIFCWPYTQHEL